MKHASPNDELRDRAILYALGALEDVEAREFERHLSEDCEVCRGEVDAYRRLTGEIGLAVRPAPPDASVRERLLGRIRRLPTEDPSAGRFEFVLATEGSWETVQPGVHRKDLGRGTGPENHGYLIRLDPGTSATGHAHDISEHCYVVSGDVFIGGRHLEAGDYHLALPGSAHDVVRSRGGCVLLVVEIAART